MPTQAPSAYPIMQSTAFPTIVYNSSSISTHPPSSCPFSPSARALHALWPRSRTLPKPLVETRSHTKCIRFLAREFTIRPLGFAQMKMTGSTVVQVALSKRTTKVVCRDDKRVDWSSSPPRVLDSASFQLSCPSFSFREAGIRQRRITVLRCSENAEHMYPSARLTTVGRRNTVFPVSFIPTL